MSNEQGQGGIPSPRDLQHELARLQQKNARMQRHHRELHQIIDQATESHNMAVTMLGKMAELDEYRKVEIQGAEEVIEETKADLKDLANQYNEMVDAFNKAGQLNADLERNNYLLLQFFRAVEHAIDTHNPEEGGLQVTFDLIANNLAAFRRAAQADKQSDNPLRSFMEGISEIPPVGATPDQFPSVPIEFEDGNHE